jgi:outer membrane protein OmpA-like peptidoglycan-associated protein
MSANSHSTTAARADSKPSFSMVATEVRSTRYAIFFDNGSAVIGPQGRAAFDNFAADAIRAESIELVGRTDSTGTRQANQKLAQRRADAVRQRLVAEGVPADRIASAAARRVEVELKVRELTAPVTRVRGESDRSGGIPEGKPCRSKHSHA